MRFTVEAYGEGLTYQWQSSVNGGKTWGSSSAGGYNTASMTVKLQAHNPGYMYRCKVTDANGNVVYSEPAEIKVGQVKWDFTYDANGMRTKRTNGTTIYSYVYNGSQLSQMTVDGQTMRFTYGTDGAPTSVTYGTNRFFYVKNLQGDVMALVDTEGTVVVEYTYDAWGNILTTSGSKASTLGKHNPLRYRGYVYDQETELYYLQSRYYDPEVGRFINADAYTSTGQGILGNNMFAYCCNNPTNRLDPLGHAFTDIFAVCYGGASSTHYDIQTDGAFGSEELAQYVLDYYVPSGSSSVSVDVVRNDEPYYHTNITTHVGNGATVIGGVALGVSAFAEKIAAAFPSSVSITGPVIAGASLVGNYATTIGFCAFIAGSCAMLPDGNYSQYSVSATWTTLTHPIGYPSVSIYTTYTAEMLFVWNNGCEGCSAYWHLIDYTYNATSRTYD